MKLVTSNINEFNEFLNICAGFDAAIGIDLPEIMSNDPGWVGEYQH